MPGRGDRQCQCLTHLGFQGREMGCEALIAGIEIAGIGLFLFHDQFKPYPHETTADPGTLLFYLSLKLAMMGRQGAQVRLHCRQVFSQIKGMAHQQGAWLHRGPVGLQIFTINAQPTDLEKGLPDGEGLDLAVAKDHRFNVAAKAILAEQTLGQRGESPCSLSRRYGGR